MSLGMTEYFDLKVGFSCNNNCIHCVITDKKNTKDYSTQQIKDIIDSLEVKKIVGFTGGEATIRKDFLELCEYAKSKGHGVALQTNGTAFSDSDFAEKAAEVVDDVLLAIHSCDEATHDAIVQRKGMYARTIAGLKNLIKFNISFSTQTVLSSFNIKTLKDTYDFIQKIAPGTAMSMTYPHPNGAAWHNRAEVVIRYTDIYPYIQESLAAWARLLRVEAIPQCYLYPYQDQLLHYFDTDIIGDKCRSGGIDPANTNSPLFDEFGRIDDYAVADRSEKRKAPKCVECVFNSTCPGVWKEYIYIHKDHLDLYPVTQDMISPVKENIENISTSSKCEGRRGALILSSNIKCSNTCVFCSGRALLETSESIRSRILKEAQWFIDNGYIFVEISGGDPVEMYDILLEVANMLSSAGIDIQLSTHGRPLSDPELAQKVYDAGVRSVRIPLYGSNPETHNKVANIHNLTDTSSFEEAVLAIANCSDAGIKIRAQTLITQDNKEDIENIFILYSALTNDTVEFYTLGVVGISQTSYTYTGDWYLPHKDLGPYITYLLDSPFLRERDFRVIDIPYCVVQRDDPRIDNSQGTSPDLGDQDVEGDMASPENNKIPHYREKKYIPLCDECTVKYKCAGYNVNDYRMFGAWNIQPYRG